MNHSMSTSHPALPAAFSLVALLCFAGIAAAQVPINIGAANLSWQQRFLGILPLVKPDPKDPVVVTVNGKTITAAEINDYAKTEARMINATSTEESRAVFKDAMENLIGRQLLIDEAKRRNIVIPEPQVTARANEFKLTGASGEEIGGGTADPQLLEAVRGSMMIEKMLDDDFRAAKVRPTDEQIKKYYEEHRDLFVKDPGEACISHIAIKLPPNATDAQIAAAQQKAEKLYKEAQHTKDFAALAKAKSEDDRSAPKGGALGCFHPGQLPPTIEKQVFSTPVGQLTTMIASPTLGYSFIKVTERRGETFLPLNEVKPKVAIVLLDYNEDAVVKGLLKQLAKKAKIIFSKTA